LICFIKIDGGLKDVNHNYEHNHQASYLLYMFGGDKAFHQANSSKVYLLSLNARHKDFINLLYFYTPVQYIVPQSLYYFKKC